MPVEMLVGYALMGHDFTCSNCNLQLRIVASNKEGSPDVFLELSPSGTSFYADPF